MPAFEVLSLDPTTPQIRAPGAGDTYSFPRAITPSGANVTPITVSGYSLTGSNAQSMLDLSGTWNTTGTPTALKLNVTDTASNAASLLMALQVGGANQFTVRKEGTVDCAVSGTAFLRLGAADFQQFTGANRQLIMGGNALGLSFISTYSVAWSSTTTDAATSKDLFILRDAANTLAQRNGVNAQTFRVYNTFTDASNYERLDITWNAGTLQMFTVAAGAGTKRGLEIGTGTGNSSNLNFTTNGTPRWRVNGSGHIVSASDNTYDIGASGATRPRNIFAAGYVVTLSTTVASLPAAATAGAGARAFVTDANATTFLSTVAGGGANKVPVVSDGTNWLIG